MKYIFKNIKQCTTALYSLLLNNYTILFNKPTTPIILQYTVLQHCNVANGNCIILDQTLKYYTLYT